MKKIFILASVAVISAGALVAFVKPAEKKVVTSSTQGVETGKWTVDQAHSNVKFTVTHLVVSEVEGSFKLFEGSMENSKADLSDAKINFSVDVNSINTDNENVMATLKAMIFLRQINIRK